MCSKLTNTVNFSHLLCCFVMNYWVLVKIALLQLNNNLLHVIIVIVASENVILFYLPCKITVDIIQKVSYSKKSSGFVGSWEWCEGHLLLYLLAWLSGISRQCMIVLHVAALRIDFI